MKIEDAKSGWPIVGNGHIFEFLGKSLVNKNIAGSYIFSGPADLGKTTAANFFAQSLVCAAGVFPPCGRCPACLQTARGIHSDIYLIKKQDDKKNISVDEVRDFIRSLSLSSFLNSYKIGIIKSAENLSQGAVNALLKTLEEPKNKVVIILTVTDFEVLPKTIVSRGRVLRFRPVASGVIYDDLVKNHQASRSQAKNFSRLAAGRPALALKFLEDKEYYDYYNNTVKAFISFLSADLNERLEAVESVLGGEARGQEAAAAAARVIDIWQNLTRDLMLSRLKLDDLTQHEAFAGELAAFNSKLNMEMLHNLLKNFRLAREYLRVNVKSKSALEYAAVSF